MYGEDGCHHSPSHVWQRGWLTGVRTCSQCGLLPLDPDDDESPCTPDPEDHAECEQVTFSWSACDVCGSGLGGERAAVTFWLVEADR
jgi:hypothetical protein